MEYLPNKWLKLCERDANPRRKSLNRDITVAGAVPTSKYPTPFTYEIPFICFRPRFHQILWFQDRSEQRGLPLICLKHSWCVGHARRVCIRIMRRLGHSLIFHMKIISISTPIVDWICLRNHSKHVCDNI